MNYVKGKPLFTDINKDKKQFNYLDKDIESDVLIIGGGVTGAINSYYFTKENIKTILIEKDRIAHLSTSVTTSLLQYELDNTLAELKDIIGLENGITAYKMGLDALNEVEKFSNEYDFDYKKRDTLFYTPRKDEKGIIEREFELRRDNGFDVEFIDKNTYGFDLEYGLLAKNGGCEIDPYKYTNSLLEESIKKGLLVYENTEAIKMNHNKDFVEVITNYDYKIKAKKIIVATGYNTSLFTDKRFGTKFNTFNIVTKPLKNLYKDNVLVRDTKNPYHYFRTTKDNRIIFGGEDVSFDLIDNDEICNKQYDILEQKLKNMFEDVEIEYKYCGCFCSTKDNLGIVGEDTYHKNMMYCLGYGANGILFAILGARMLVKLYNGEIDQNLELFRLDRPL